MLSSFWAYLALLIGLSGTLKFAEEKTQWKLFEYLPSVVMLYLLGMLGGTLGVWELTPEIKSGGAALRDMLLPVMIYLMLLQCDLRSIAKLGGKLIAGFFAASFSIALGFVMVYFVLQSSFAAGDWKTLAALCGSWMGGTGNMLAIQQAFDVPDAAMGYTLAMDTVVYSVWVMVLLALIPFHHKFNRWSKANGAQLREVGEKLAQAEKQNAAGTSARTGTFGEVFFLLGLGLTVGALARWVSLYLPHPAFLDAKTISILLVTLLGVVSALTPIGRIPGSRMLANMALYIIVALIGSRVALTDLSEAPFYLGVGFLILGVHILFMLVFARLLKLDMFTCGVASLANIGGVAAAPVLAASYSESLVGVGVLMALLGYVIGTGGGLLVGWLLAWIG